MKTAMMKVDITTVHPNPHRDFKVYPIEPAQIEELMRSYDGSGDWGTLAARPHPTEPKAFEIAAGHHRLEAMRRLGYPTVDLKVGAYDEAEMLDIMIEENATQHGGNAQSQADSIIASAKLLAYWVFLSESLGDLCEISQGCADLFPSDKAFETYKGQLVTRSEIGRPTLTKFMKDRYKQSTVESHLASLSADGHLARVIREAQQRADAELAAKEEEARKAEEDARRQAEEEAAEEARQRAEAERQAKLAKEARERAKAAKKAADRARQQREAHEAKLAADRAKRAAEARRKEADRLEKERQQRQADMEARAKARARAEQAAAKAESTAVWLSSEANNKLTTQGHRDAFRTMIDKNKDVFPVEDQVAIVDNMIRDLGEDMTASSIRAYLTNEVGKFDKKRQEILSKIEQDRQARKESEQWASKADRVMDEAGAAFGRLHTALNAVQALMNEATTPERVARVIAEAQTSSLRKNMDVTEGTIRDIRRVFGLWQSSMAKGSTYDVDSSVIDVQ